MKKPCKECPWIVKNKHNESITNFSIKNDVAHNCHMGKNGGKNLWSIEEKTKCKGRELYEHRKKISEYS